MENTVYQEIIQEYISAYNKFDIEGMLEHMDEQVKFENIENGVVTLTTTGKTALKEQAEQAKQYFRQRQQSILALTENGHSVEATIDYSAILAVDLPNGLKAGDTLTLQGKSIFYFRNGKITHLKDIS